MISFAAGYQHFSDGAPFAEIALRHPSVGEVYFPWVDEPSGRPKLGFGEEDATEELALALRQDLSRLREAGVRLDLLLNANCYGAEAMSRKLGGNLLDLFEPGFSPAFYPQFIDNTAFPSDWFERTGSCSRECTDCGYCEECLKTVVRSLVKVKPVFAEGMPHGSDRA